MNVFLISANTLEAPYPVYPLGMDYVANTISADHQVQMLDMNTIDHYDELSKHIKKFSPDVVGISLRNIDNTDTTDPLGFMGQYQDIIAVVKKSTKASIVLGGSGFTIFPNEIMTVLDADYGVIGEGERIYLLLDAIENKKDTSEIPGIVTKNIRKNIPEPWHEAILMPIPKSTDTVDFYLKKGGMLNLQSKRGCHYNCVYCTYPHIEGKSFRLIPPEQVADMALKLQQAGAKYLFITDSTFNSNVEHSINVARAIKNAGVNIPWGAFFSPMKMPDDYFRIMADSGLKHVEFGTDTMSEKMLVSYRKPFGLNDIYHSHQAAVDAGINVAHFFVLGGPDESHATLDETLTNVDRLKKTVLFFFCGMRIYPHTKLYEIAINKVQIKGSDQLLDPVFFQPDAIENNEIVKKVKELAKDHPNWVTGSGGEDTVNITSKMYEKGYSGPLWEYLIR